MILVGISNLTPTENKLRNFSRICKLVGASKGAIEYEELVNMAIGDPSIRRGKRGKEGRYTKTIERHIKIAETLEILRKSNNDINLSSLGKVLYELVKDRNDFEENLGTSEKIFYFITLFSKPVATKPVATQTQLLILLKSIGNKKNKSKNDKIVDYIQSILALPSDVRIFNKEYLKKCIRRYQADEVFPKGITNKFDCMTGWLKDLELIIRGLVLTPVGEKIISELRPSPQTIRGCYQKIGENLLRLSHYILDSTEFPTFDENNIEHEKAVINLFKTAYSKFYRPSIKMSDVPAIRMWLSINLLISENIIMEERDFDTFLENQVRKGNFKSIAKNDKGRLAYVEI